MFGGLPKLEFDADLKGYIPEVRALLQAKCNASHEPDLQGCPMYAQRYD